MTPRIAELVEEIHEPGADWGPGVPSPASPPRRCPDGAAAARPRGPTRLTSLTVASRLCLDRLAREFALDRVRLCPSPRAVVDPQRMAGHVVVIVDRLGQSDIEKLAPELLAIAAPSHPEGEVSPDWANGPQRWSPQIGLLGRPSRSSPAGMRVEGAVGQPIRPVRSAENGLFRPHRSASCFATGVLAIRESARVRGEPSPRRYPKRELVEDGGIVRRPAFRQ
jgi:hypothetical protein